MLRSGSFGVVYAMTTVETPILVRAVFGNKDYGHLLPDCHCQLAHVCNRTGGMESYRRWLGRWIRYPVWPWFALMLSCLILALLPSGPHVGQTARDNFKQKLTDVPQSIRFRDDYVGIIKCESARIPKTVSCDPVVSKNGMHGKLRKSHVNTMYAHVHIGKIA